MIGRIAGIILHRAQDHVLIDVRGVGYIVHVSERTAASLPPAGQATALYTELLVREDLLQLFGFPSLLEKEWHRLLTSVQGVGAKVSLAILGTLSAEGLSRALALGGSLSVDLGPMPDAEVIESGGTKKPTPAPRVDGNAQATADALSALSNLGYAPSEAAGAVAEAQGREPGAPTAALIRAALRLLAPKE